MKYPNSVNAGSLATILKTQFIIAIFILSSVISYSQNDCIPTLIEHDNWTFIDSSSSYFICPNSSNTKLEQGFYQLKYLGRLKSDGGIVIESLDSITLCLFANISFGKFSNSEGLLPQEMKSILPQLGKKSKTIIRYNFRSFTPFIFPRLVTVYFKSQVDSSKINRWLLNVSKSDYIDSINYISNEEAIKKWEKTEDTTWRRVLQNYPLPSSAEMYLTQNFYNDKFLKDLKVELLKDEFISDVIYLPSEKRKEWDEVSNRLRGIFYVELTK